MSNRGGRVTAGTVLLLGLLAGCAAPPTLGTSSSAYGTIEEIAAEDRGESIEFGGELDTGAIADSRDWIGSVVVVNFWYAACPPCRAEAPDLESLYQRFMSEDVVFIGVNVRDSAPTARSFAATFGISYPSIMDATVGDARSAFAGQIAPNAVPTTIVLDREGRAAARIVGQIPSRGTLETLVESVLDEEGA